jgi:hypothetical protein
MATRVIPGKQQLEAWLDEGLTQGQMVQRVYEQTGVTVTRSGIAAAMMREGLGVRDVPRYHDEVPWRVRPEHLRAYPVRMLRLLGRRNQGGSLKPSEIERLDAWLARLADEGLVVAYDPDSPSGFLYVDREDGDPSEVPIRRRRVWLNPPPIPPEPRNHG